MAALFVDRSWPVPSFKSWTNALTVIVQLALFLGLHGLLAHCGPHVKAQGDVARAELGQPAPNEAAQDAMGDRWHEENRERKMKVGAWLRDQRQTMETLLVVICSLLPQIELHGALRRCDSDDYLVRRRA